MGNLSKHFSKWEFECACGTCGYGLNEGDVDPQLIEKLELIRKFFGSPVTITNGGGCRCEKEARAIYRKQHKPFNPKSQHLFGRAADIAVVIPGRLNWTSDNPRPYKKRLPPIEVARFADSIMWFEDLVDGGKSYPKVKVKKTGGIIVYPTFVHIDVRPGKAYRWGLKVEKRGMNSRR